MKSDAQLDRESRIREEKAAFSDAKWKQSMMVEDEAIRSKEVSNQNMWIMTGCIWILAIIVASIKYA